MSTYQTTDSSGNFSYELKYTQYADGWQLNSVSILERENEIFSKKNLEGVYRAEAVLLAQGVNMCEALIACRSAHPSLNRMN
ncbi:hypothetical protein [Herbaspirillum frisingense]|jgi:hypothetical protein|uniref:hypothetical protein n=1 Tax=Herbaspirillum frisingense TaxID=92645 RepID=UPI001F2F40D2|nr:hypothetical protein [Herbaspirillum frisingense]UIN20807.1 hypothetical protein LAZ82_20415 [Herbaspirillum frisingense]